MAEPEYDQRGRKISGEGPEWDTRPPDRPDVRAEYGNHPAAQLLLMAVALFVVVVIVRAIG